MGEKYDAPLYHLLGGKTRHRIPTYNTCIGTPDVPDYDAWYTDGHLDIPAGPGLGIRLNPDALERDDLVKEISEGEGLAKGRRAMGDHWAVEDIR